MKILSRWPFHPLLLAAYAVLFVYAANISEVLLEQLVEPLLLALGLAVVVFAGAALLFRDLRRGALLASAVLLTLLFFGHAAFQLGGAGIPEEAQLVAWVVFIVAVAVYAWRARGSLATMTAGLNVFTADPGRHVAHHHRPGRDDACRAGLGGGACDGRRRSSSRRETLNGTSTS